MARKGFLRIDGLNLCYTDSYDNKHELPYDSGYSVAVGLDKAGYIWIEETDGARIYYIDELGTKRRTTLASNEGNVGVDKEGSMWVGLDGYLWFVNHSGDMRKIDGTITYLGLCFMGTSGSTINLKKYGTITVIDNLMEISYDGSTWSDYTIGDVLTYNNDGDKIYFRNKSGTAINSLNYSSNSRYTFETTGDIRASGDIGYMLCKYSTDNVPAYGYTYLFYNSTGLVIPPDLPASVLGISCYEYMFKGCTSLITAPALPAINLSEYWSATSYYSEMFYGCSNLETLPALPSVKLPRYCYNSMFQRCSKIKLSETKHDEYQYEYRIPITGEGGTPADGSLSGMFTLTGGEWTGTPEVNKTYYTSNKIII